MLKKRFINLITIALIILFVSGCGGDSGDGSSQSIDTSNKGNTQTSEKGSRDNKANVLTPSAPGTDIKGNSYVEFDVSNSSEGYIYVTYLGNSNKVKIQVTGEDQITYTYDVNNDPAVIPLTSGNGNYLVGCYENIGGTSYAEVYSENIAINITNTFGPFLYPNQYVNFEASSQTVKKASEIVAPANNDLDAVTDIYTYVITNVTYDYDKANTVQSGYLPVVDDTLKSGKGICFDYASLMSAMLRSQGIPTKLVIGYADTAYHAWISVYIKDTGWVNNIIYFDGENWTLMDPTFAAGMDNQEELKEYVGDGSHYNALYVY